MLQAAKTDPNNPLVSKARNSGCQNSFPPISFAKIYPAKSVEASFFTPSLVTNENIQRKK